MQAETRQKRTEEQIVQDMENDLRKRRQKLIARQLVKVSGYMKRLKTAKAAVAALATCPDWPTEEPYAKKLLDVIELERSRLVESNDSAP